MTQRTTEETMSTLTLSPALGRRRTASRAAELRLTRRGRLLAFAVLLAALLAAIVALGPSVIASSEAGDPVPVRTVVVQPGETLWDIASRANPTGNVGDMVFRIAELNALPSAGDVQIGQEIAIPID